MANKKEQYLMQNAQFLEDKRKEEGVRELRGGVLYKVIESGDGEGEVKPRSIVTCYYKGALINGKVFDDAFKRGYPEAFRVNELINGFQIALVNMHIGDHWEVYIPSDMGYGPKGDRVIPGGSTLIFEIKLVGIA
ncbi:MAG: FKBP-type peptidyl-prolyl cis-trans isomerase [Prevotellaceae bacterium]|nr:FKBP-type peptidyl-prolyl cis-trans isomerase [Candidatus Minthosoma caballi]